MFSFDGGEGEDSGVAVMSGVLMDASGDWFCDAASSIDSGSVVMFFCVNSWLSLEGVELFFSVPIAGLIAGHT